MARTDTLGHFLTDVADAIRTKTGSSETILASDFDTEIENIPSGGGASEYLTETITNGALTQAGILKSIKKLPSFQATGTTLAYAFAGCQELVEIGNITNTTNVTNIVYMFNGCSKLAVLPLFDTSNVTNFLNAFNACENITVLPAYNTSKNAIFNSMFAACTKLITVPQFDTGKATNMSNMCYSCPALSNDSLNNIMAMCINATNYTGTKTLRYIGMSAAQTTICQGLSNYQGLLDAGWTTGF